MNQIFVTLNVGTLILLIFLLFFNISKINKRGNYWLCGFLLCLLFFNIDEFLMYQRVDVSHFLVPKFYIFPLYAVAPVFYFTVLYFIKPETKWKSWYFLHFIFAVLFVVFENNSTQITGEKIIVNPSNSSAFTEVLNFFLMNIVLPGQALFYSYLSLKLLGEHRKNVTLFSSNVDSIDLKWLRYIIYYTFFLGLILVIDIITLAIPFMNLALLLGIFLIGFNALRQEEIFPFERESLDEIGILVGHNVMVLDRKKNVLSAEKLTEFKRRLTDVMENEKLFLNQDLNLLSLAKMVDLPPNKLSQIINEGFGENFNSFVNRYRIEEAKKLILDPKLAHLNILGISAEVGFKSKSVFNTTFKKYTDQTPKEFKKSNSH